MLYSGVDLVRSSSLQHERLDRLNAADAPLRPVANAESATDQGNPGGGGALLRFARFLHDEDKKKKTPPAPRRKGRSDNPYQRADLHRQALFERGLQLDLYA